MSDACVILSLGLYTPFHPQSRAVFFVLCDVAEDGSYFSGSVTWSILSATRSYFSEGNSVSFPEKDDRGWGFDILCMRSPGVTGDLY